MRFSRIIGTLCFAALTSFAGAQTLTDAWVATTGSDLSDGSQGSPFATIQKAIDETLAGGTVHITPGTYVPAAQINVTRSVTLLGDGGMPEIQFPAGAANLNVTSSDVTIQNLHLQKTDTSTDTGIIVVQRGGVWAAYFCYENIDIIGCVIEGGRRGGMIAAKNLLIEDCIFLNQYRDALYLSSSQGTTTIRNNNFVGASGTRKSILFENLSSEDPETEGDILIEGNTHNGKTNFIVFGQWQGDNTADINFTVRNNSVDNCSSSIIAFYVAFLQDPAAFQRFTSININENIFTNSATRWGVFVDYDDYGSALDDELKPVPADGQINVANNIWYNLAGLYGFDTSATPSGASNDMFGLTDNLEADPLYNDPTHANYDFSVASNSPARGAGDGLTNIGADQTNAPLFGDANNDNNVDNVDAVYILEIFLDLKTQNVPDAQIDINQDGIVDNVDAVILFNFVVGNVPSIPYP